MSTTGGRRSHGQRAASSQGHHHDGAGSVTDSRRRQIKRDEAIRQKMESSLGKKKHQSSNRSRGSRKAVPGTVMALRPGQALQIKPHITVAEAAQLMAAKREDCVLVTDDDDRIAGIFTAKDLAFRVVGAGIDARDAIVSDIMTKNPMCAITETSATDALDLMVRKGFRHLPVMDENQDISGVLDITKCFYEAMEKLERSYSMSRKLHDALEGVQELGGAQPTQIIQYVEALRSKMAGPTLETVLSGIPPTTVNVRTSVREAAALMKENHTTAVLVQDQGNITGIFTSKDVVLRVIAPGLDPATCSVVRVMTPHPDFASMDLSIQAALRKMHDGHYLNLPVMNDSGEIVGMVDVLKLTYATLEQINSMQTGDNEGPAWNKFWLSMDNDSESVVSDSVSHHMSLMGSESPSMMRHPTYERPGTSHSHSVLPNDSASHVGDDSPPHSHVMLTPPAPSLSESNPFTFKFKAPSGRVHRFAVIPSAGFPGLVHTVTGRLGAEISQVGGETIVNEEGHIEKTGFAISYIDDENDLVSITSDQDLLDAINLARRQHRDKVDIYVHDADHPPNIEAPPPPPPPPPVDTEKLEAVEEVKRLQRQATELAEKQHIPGVPNELLMPGAVATLAVAIIIVFVFSRSGSR
ncbi:hypothetical protein H072_7055 [Dactylellina haptotyla CBS 200.50]|uniref:CBS domain-containing protein n=1 Tax=Dactylellina haptotyla (strain CBS 200.50) TaxID=1284197 RepID=S8BV32_DACHA|nr:hypothetical protein H072_7055 [Dactylellina haptotyla CBS 200.50]